jgi:glycosyltransferase involved in cell wall biosynthesis
MSKLATILFYSPFNERSRDTESLMLAFRRQGHKVISLSQAPGEQIHEFLNDRGIETASYVLRRRSTIIYFLRHIFFFIGFCYRHKINVVYSHLESANFVAAISSFFIRARVFVCRHHVDEAALQGFNRSLLYILTYRLAPKIIVVSNRAAHYMAATEKISPRKILKINLAYDFNLYRQCDSGEVARIRQNYPGILLLTVCRLTVFKRADLSVRVLHRLIDRGMQAKLIVLGRGEEHDNLIKLAQALGVREHVLLAGYVNNVNDYIEASNFVLHPSVLESSCVTVKEAGLRRKPVIVCSGVGDFDDYIVNGVNGFLVDRDLFVEQASAVVADHHDQATQLENIGANLEKSVRELFSIEHLISLYEPLNSV